MSGPQDWMAELNDLLERLVEHRLTAEDRTRLNALLAQGVEPRRYYRDYLRLHCALELRIGGPGFEPGSAGPSEECIGGEMQSEATDAQGSAISDCKCEIDKTAATRVPSLTSPFFLLPSMTGGAVLCYAMTLLVLAAGLTAAQFWTLADDSQQLVSSIASSPIQVVSAPNPGPSGPGPIVIATVTGTSGCRWADASPAARPAEQVIIGHTYALVSGLLEIRYNTGAKVILEGPAVFSADRTNGGALRFGKLTVLAPKFDRAKLARDEAARNHPAPPPHAPGFVVRTPSARVYGGGDQIGEFGVEVCRSQTTYTRVYKGPVAFAAPGLPAYALPDDYCVWTGAGPRHDGLMIFHTGHESSSFALEVPKAAPVCATPLPEGKANQPKKAGSG
jgi:hypothetical protein